MICSRTREVFRIKIGDDTPKQLTAYRYLETFINEEGGTGKRLKL